MADLSAEEIGNDVSTIPDLDLTWTPITGNRVVAEGVIRMWGLEPKGMFWDLNRGAGIENRINADMTNVEREQLRMILIAEALKVDGVRRIQVTVTKTARGTVIYGDLLTRAGRSRFNVPLVDGFALLSQAEFSDTPSQGTT